MTGTKERPILFSGPMVRAILDGRKTQTRRVVKSHLPTGPCDVRDIGNGPEIYGAGGAWLPLPCPYGKIGKRLWVRETWQPHREGSTRFIRHRADQHFTEVPADAMQWYGVTDDSDALIDKWRPSIHMPRWASRITLEITDVRVERVREISVDDAIEEGCRGLFSPSYFSMGEVVGPDLVGPIDEFANLWDSINADRGFGWDVNPWVWVVEFKRINR